MSKKNIIFLTGTTGLVGSYLLKVLIEDGHEVFCLARDSGGKSAEERVREVLRFWDVTITNRSRGNLHVIRGDITKIDLGMGGEHLSDVMERVEEIFHCAALTRFNAPLEELRRVNVEGTKNVLDTALKLQRLKKVNYTSTVFICGDYNGTFTESTLDVKQRFHSPYARSKFEAEKLVEMYRKKGLWVDVFRLPIVVGESKTGKVLSFNRACYQLIRSWNYGLFPYFPADKNFFLDIVFVDEICYAMLLISSMSRRKNQTYHPFIPQRVMGVRMMSWAAEELCFPRPEIIPFEEFYGKHTTFVKSNILRYNLFFINRFVKYDCKMTLKYLAGKGFKFARFDKKKFIKLLKYGLDKGFFKKQL